ncbi:DNA lyase Apn2 [Microdochium trichocladiopsis]|uniref:DNA-(apurinic or apyrimidinic site) endonuclease 2 n=1 Tax=Microdochium trichocladiopsis TaxID=1682393 RepID=A0A9P9BTX8_9PEZI|nr:DNA lyase Apn2 [Microdochium trichocladiopsis]KAH7037482.1 DNA lyase Apn2 [Microdochium trichocladiopsis]
MGIRITSWNVNGIRNPFGYQPWRETRSFESMFDILEADIVVMQELKIQRKDLRDDMVLVPGWDVYFSLPKHKKGYSGVAIYTRNSVCSPIRAEEGITGCLSAPGSDIAYRDLPEEQQIGGYPRPGQLPGEIDDVALDSEGRCVILEFPAFVIIGTYSPANSDGTRDDFKVSYLEALDVRIRNLVAMGKQVVLTGDLNVVRDPIDTAGLHERLRKEGMTMDDYFSMPSRRIFHQLLIGGKVKGGRDESREKPILWDLGRLFHPDRQGMYTCWDTKKNSRPGNFGSRIDYVLCSPSMKEWFSDANIQEGLMGSDHCPVFAVMKDVVQIDGKDVHLRDLMNPAGMFENGKRLQEWSTRNLLPLSAKLIAEFDRRQSIKDMFFKKPSQPAYIGAAVSANGASESATRMHIPPSPVKSGITTPAPDSNETILPAATPSNGGLKRTPSGSATPQRPTTKTKAALTKEPSSKGQSSLMGFFKPKTAPKPEMPQSVPNSEESTASPPPPSSGISEYDEKQASPNKGDLQVPPSPEKVIDQVQSRETWSKLLGKRVVPKCEHGEDCISLVTKKAGFNKGRSFYICPRPLGPSGEKEKGTEWRCGTFIWSSDWTSKSQ